MYRIPAFTKLRPIGHVLWDIDGTITDPDGFPNQGVMAKIINLGMHNIYHSFATGRDADWIIDNLINPMQEFHNFGVVRNSLTFFAEVGSIEMSFDPTANIRQTINPEIETHPLFTNENNIRQILRDLTHDPDKLPHLNGRKRLKASEEVIYDANNQGFIIDHLVCDVPCYPYVWSTSKRAFATFEKIRDERGGIKTFNQDPFNEIILRAIKNAGFEDDIDTEVISTAINIVPKINGNKLGKSWASGRAIENIYHKVKGHHHYDISAVMDQTIAVGDGKADLDFTRPLFDAKIARRLTRSDIPIIFVGSEHDLPPKTDPLRANIVIQATGYGRPLLTNPNTIEMQPTKGACVVSEVLDFLKLWEYFRPF